MKKGISFLMTFVLCLSLLTACGTTPVDDSQKTPEVLIQEGDAALANGNTEEARIKYKAAGAPAEEKLTEVLLQISRNYTVGDPAAHSVKIAMDHLSNIPESGRTRQDVAERMVEVAEQYLKLMEEAQISDPEEDFLPAKDLLDDVLYTEIPEYSAAVEKLGWMWGYAHLDSKHPEKAIPVWEGFPDHPTLKTLAEAGKLLQQKEYTRGVGLIRENVENYADFDHHLFDRLTDTGNNTLEQSVDYTAAAAMLYTFGPAEPDEQGAWIDENGVFDELRTTMEKHSEAPDLTAEDLEDLKTKVGQEPDGKILILSRRREYEATETKLELYDEANYILPLSCIPARLEQVQYVILIDNDYLDTGETFNVGTKLLKETAVIQVYKAGNPNPLYTSSKRETIILPTTTLMMYNGEAPVYFVPDHPYIGSDMKDALKTIMNEIY